MARFQISTLVNLASREAITLPDIRGATLRLPLVELPPGPERTRLRETLLSLAGVTTP